MMEITDLTEEERIRLEAEEIVKREKFEREQAKKEKELYERKTAECKNILDNLPGLGVALVFPNAKDMYSGILAELVNEAGLIMQQTERIEVTKQMLEDIFYFAEPDEEEEEKEEKEEQEAKTDNEEGEMSELDAVILSNFNKESLEILLSKQGVALMIKAKSGHEIESILDEVLKLVYGEMMAPPGSEESPAKLLCKVEDDEESGETKYLTGIWAPRNYCMMATCLKQFFPKSAIQYAIPEPEPIPPHYAVVFDITKFHDALAVINKYPHDIMNHGFFTTDKPEEAELIAKTYHKLEKSGKRTFTEKLVIAVSAKKSECMFELAQLEPIRMSPNTEEGEKECEMFFPEELEDGPEEQLEEEEDEEEEEGEVAIGEGDQTHKIRTEDGDEEGDEDEDEDEGDEWEEEEGEFAGDESEEEGTAEVGLSPESAPVEAAPEPAPEIASEPAAEEAPPPAE
ncbi:hypothetical protein NQ317_007726 [Molorchus minor]|uniref:DUF4746 domain-containing protein n=1 Tax=Molorchus minor TaxID=1323400 RepID=A0ABQ9JVD9_9CUCU|nr:hypothetical protein NQ317_007726 [Molorchus minor]